MTQDVVRGRPSKFVLSTLILTHLAQHFYAGVPILYQSIRTDLVLSYSDIGIVAGVTNIVGGLLQIVYSIAGRLIPRRTLLGCANFAMGLGCLIMGLADRFTALLLGNIIAGVGQAGQHPMSVSIISQKFSKKKIARALSAFYGLGYIGTILSPIMLSTIAMLASWRVSLFLLALIPLATGVNVLHYLRREPAGDRITGIGRRDLKSIIVSLMGIKDALFVIAAQSFIVGGTGLGVLTIWIPQFLRDPVKGLGLGIGEAGLLSSLTTTGGVIGTIVIGRLADRLGHLRTAIICLCSTIVTIYLLTLHESATAVLVPHLFITGVTVFAIPTLLQSHLTTISTASQRDILLGLFFTFGFGVGTLWAAIIGRLIDAFSFRAAWTLMSALGLLALSMLFIASRHHDARPITHQRHGGPKSMCALDKISGKK